MHKAVFVGAARTPIGSFMGALSLEPAVALGAVAIRGALKRSGLKAKRLLASASASGGFRCRNFA